MAQVGICCPFYASRFVGFIVYLFVLRFVRRYQLALDSTLPRRLPPRFVAPMSGDPRSPRSVLFLCGPATGPGPLVVGFASVLVLFDLGRPSPGTHIPGLCWWFGLVRVFAPSQPFSARTYVQPTFSLGICLRRVLP